MSSTPEPANPMDDAKKQLRRSVIKVRNLLWRAEQRQRLRIERLHLSVEKRATRTLQGVQQLFDFDPTSDLKECLELHSPSTESPAPERHRHPSASQPGNKKFSTRSREATGRIGTRRAKGEFGKQPTRKERPATGQVDAQKQMPAGGNLTIPTIEKPQPRKTDSRPAKAAQHKAQTKDPQRPVTEQSATTTARSKAKATGPDRPSSKSTDRARKSKPSLAEQRRQWVRSHHAAHAVGQQAKNETGTRIVKKPTDPADSPSRREVPLPAADSTPTRSTAPAVVDSNRKISQNGSGHATVAPRDEQLSPAVTRRGVRIDPIESESAVSADGGQATQTPGEPTDEALPSGSSDLARELAETVYLHGIDRT